MNTIYKFDAYSELDLVIRKATCDDFDDLTAVCRSWRADMLRWRAPKSHSRKWWKLLLDAEYCEIWVCLSHGQIVGFVLIAFDRVQYEDAWMKHHPNPLIIPYMFAFCPKLFIKVALQKLKHRSKVNMQKLLGTPSNNSQIPASEKMKKLFESKVPWIGPICVIPSMRGKGLAAEMLKFCIKRATDLGYKETKAYIEESNVGSRRLFRKLGFTPTEKVYKFVFYRKILSIE